MPANQLLVKDTNYTLANLSRPVVFTDDAGNEFRISLHQSGTGITVNKAEGEVFIKPKVTNEVHIL